MKSWNRILITCTLLLATAMVGRAQEITFTASVDRNTIAAGEHVKLTIALTNAQERFSAPELGGLVIVQGPFESSGMTNYNGRVSFSINRTWLLTAATPGKYTIGPARVKVGGGFIQTEPITITVTKGNTPPPNDPAVANGQQRDPNLFTTISVSRNKGYVGEQVVVTYSLYSRYRNMQSVTKEMPKISGAWTEEVDLGEPRWEEKLQTVNGVQYQMAILRRQVLIPQRSGKLRIAPFQQTCVIDRTIFNQGRTVVVNSNAVEYTVLDLPAGAPASFTGAVGELQMTVQVSRTELPTDESVDITIRYSGRGNLKLIEAPGFSLPPDLEVYDPKVIDKVVVNAGGMSGSREFQYLVIPRQEGKYELPAISFSYFDTRTASYRTVSEGPFALNVTPGSGTPSTGVQRPSRTDVQQLDQDVRYIRIGDLGLEPRGTQLFGSLPWIAGMTTPAVAFLILLVWRRKQERADADVVGTRRRLADRSARSHLKLAHQALAQNDRDAFYTALAKALNGYVADKFGLGVAELSGPVLERHLQATPDGPAIASTYQRMITVCDMARFAPVEEVPRERLYEEAVALISRIEQHAHP